MNHKQIDARGMRCPMPLLKLKQGLSDAAVGDILTVVATDAGSWRDIPAYVALTAHILIDQKESTDEYLFVVEKGE